MIRRPPRSTRTEHTLSLHDALPILAMDRLALSVAHHGRQRRFIVAKLVDRGQVAREDHPDQREPEQARDGGIGKPAEPAARPHAAKPAGDGIAVAAQAVAERSEEHTSELQSLMRISYAVFCLKKKRT